MENDEDYSKPMRKVKKNPPETMDASEHKAGEHSEIKISSWNINGIRAVNSRGDLKKYLLGQHIDILCLNETKIDAVALDQLNELHYIPKEYHQYWNCCKTKKGYSGVAVMTRIKPIKVTHDIGITKHDGEGRTLTLEFDKFFLVSCYVPNAGQKLERLSYRTKEWDKDFQAYLNGLSKQKPTILTGDLNVAHQEIDISNPKGNLRSAGFTKEERAEFEKLLSDGWVDTFRKRHPEVVKYSYFSARSNAREENKGWRLDYFLASKEADKAVTHSDINEKIYGSDHLPVELTLDLSKL